jgi:hypothetical protein
VRIRSLTLLGAGVAAAAALGAAGAAAGAHTPAGGRTLQFVTAERLFTTVPAGSKAAPPQLGSRMLFEDVMFNRVAQFGKPRGARVGRAEGVCTLMSATRPEAQCLITAHVPDGQIVVAGEGDPGARITRYAVTGGIGAYANARGTVTATAINPERTLVVIHLAS